MSVTKLPSGRWRAQVHQPGKGNVSVSKILGGPGTFATQKEAKRAREEARKLIEQQAPSGPTVNDFRDRWLTDPLFARPKRSTMLHNTERTKAFAAKYGDLPLTEIGDDIVGEWLAGGNRRGTVDALRAMFNDAKSGKAGRLIQTNPFAELGLAKTKGNRGKKPPTLEQVEKLVTEGYKLTPPSFAAYLEFACFTGIRPGEIDALRWDSIDFTTGEIRVVEQWNSKVREFTTPKYGAYEAALTDRARQAILRMPRENSDSPFVFLTTRRTHYTPSSRAHHWNRVRAGVGMGNVTLYMATKHAFGAYALNVLGLAPHVIAEQFGHKDGGKLVVQLYGHPDGKVAREQIRQAFDRQQKVTPLRVVKEEGA